MLNSFTIGHCSHSARMTHKYIALQEGLKLRFNCGRRQAISLLQARLGADHCRRRAPQTSLPTFEDRIQFFDTEYARYLTTPPGHRCFLFQPMAFPAASQHPELSIATCPWV